MEIKFKSLGQNTTGPSKELESFPQPAHVTRVAFRSRELTSNCPVTGQPDLYAVEIVYHPAGLCLESKSLKRYLWSFRQESLFAETLADTIAQDVVNATGAAYCRVTLVQNVRGGLELETVAEMGDPAAKQGRKDE